MSDYSALAQRVSLSIAGIRGCLMLSRDGLVLGAHPEGEPEADLRTEWVRFAGVGDPERSYIEFPDQIWAFVRRGSYAAFAVADVGVRPGVLVDTLEQALLSAEQERVVDRDAMRLPEAPAAPSGKPRTSLHMPDRQPTSEPEPAVVRVEAADDVAAETSPADEVAAPPPTEVGDAPAEEPDPPAGDVPETQEGKEEESEVDRILLAKEFAGLLQVPREDDEASR
ncbi:MAG: hypothetical protein K0R20_1468 [Actinomycetia bacterium]|jgi:hypothetical protein|nr:hypothetical protein [Actinomycetes bacterium]